MVTFRVSKVNLEEGNIINKILNFQRNGAGLLFSFSFWTQTTFTVPGFWKPPLQSRLDCSSRFYKKATLSPSPTTLALTLLIAQQKAYQRNILEPVLGRPFSYSAKHCSKLLLKKDFIPFLSSYAHSFITACIFFLL
jgi:hypothetical protein